MTQSREPSLPSQAHVNQLSSDQSSGSGVVENRQWREVGGKRLWHWGGRVSGWPQLSSCVMLSKLLYFWNLGFFLCEMGIVPSSLDAVRRNWRNWYKVLVSLVWHIVPLCLFTIIFTQFPFFLQPRLAFSEASEMPMCWIIIFNSELLGLFYSNFPCFHWRT